MTSTVRKFQLKVHVKHDMAHEWRGLERLPEGAEGCVDVNGEGFAFLRRFETRCGKFPGSGVLQFCEWISTLPVDGFDDAERSGRLHGTSGAYYWIMFLEGFRQHVQEGGRVTAKNIFYEYLFEYFNNTKFDPNLEKEFLKPEKIMKRILRRYMTLLKMVGDNDYLPLPISLISDCPEGGSSAREARHAPVKFIACDRIDGYHRIFSTFVLGRRFVPYKTLVSVK